MAADPAQAAALALAAGVDVELPTVRCFGAPLIGAVERGEVAEALVDRAARRVLLQKCELGMLDPSWDPGPATADGVDLDPPSARQIAARLAEESIILLANDGILPLSGPLADGGRIAVVGPRADDPLAMLGCYSFPSHVGVKYPDLDIGVEIPTFLAALRQELPDSDIGYSPGCGVDDPDPSGIAAAAALAAGSDVCIAVVGDRSGLFGRGTSGEGCDAADLNLPGIQGQLLDALLATGTPVVIVLLTGRPYALGPFPAAAVVQAFFPGQEGGPALARVLSGAANPSGRLPVSVPRHVGAQPTTYIGSDAGPPVHGQLHRPQRRCTRSAMACRTPPSAGRTSKARPPRCLPTAPSVSGSRSGTWASAAGTEVVQLYLHDPVAQVTRPTVAAHRLRAGAARAGPAAPGRVHHPHRPDLLHRAGWRAHRGTRPDRAAARDLERRARSPACRSIWSARSAPSVGPRQMTARRADQLSFRNFGKEPPDA